MSDKLLSLNKILTDLWRRLTTLRRGGFGLKPVFAMFSRFCRKFRETKKTLGHVGQSGHVGQLGQLGQLGQFRNSVSGLML